VHGTASPDELESVADLVVPDLSALKVVVDKGRVRLLGPRV